MMTCRKTYHDIPFAHRQAKHEGHCALVHGHNWSFSFTFGCREPDANGFVIDFGKLHFIRREIEARFDHAFVFGEDDPLREQLLNAAPDAIKPYVVSNCSCEGLCRHLYDLFDPMVREHTRNRVFLVGVEVEEDRRNSAAWFPATPGDQTGREGRT